MPVQWSADWLAEITNETMPLALFTLHSASYVQAEPEHPAGLDHLLLTGLSGSSRPSVRPSDMHENVVQVILPQTALTIWFINRRFTLLLHCSNKANLRVCMHCLESQPYCYIKWPIGILPKRALRIIHGDQIKGMPYQNALFLANLESSKDRRIKLSQSFFKKILSTDSCLHRPTLLPPERNNEIFSKLRNPLNYLISYSRTKKYQSFLNYALANFQNSMWFVFYCTFYFSYCELLIVYFISCVLIVT